MDGTFRKESVFLQEVALAIHKQILFLLFDVIVFGETVKVNVHHFLVLPQQELHSKERQKKASEAAIQSVIMQKPRVKGESKRNAYHCERRNSEHIDSEHRETEEEQPRQMLGRVALQSPAIV